jgi:hypothetical protein
MIVMQQVLLTFQQRERDDKVMNISVMTTYHLHDGNDDFDH